MCSSLFASDFVISKHAFDSCCTISKEIQKFIQLSNNSPIVSGTIVLLLFQLTDNVSAAGAKSYYR